MSKDWLSHFHADERSFAVRVEEWLERAVERHLTKVTDFLDPRQAEIFQSVAVRSGGAAVRFDGGYPEAERKRAIIVPDYRDPEDVDAAISILAVTSTDDRMKALEHGDYMGAILGLGIKRDKIGDIHVLEDGCHYVVASEVADFLDLNLRQVHRVQVLTELIPREQLRTAETAYEIMSLSVASMRLDGIVSDVCGLSRAKALVPIQGGRCRVNWKVEENPGKQLAEGDVVSVQGFGRFRILELEGVSKKGRIRLKAGKYR